ncbi:prepilin-type N-terminal cleavage/methylation domain [Marinomonas fungiae]|uniref:Prepilin-type N-terminal cleavage/methylation domain n=2 Tax=Marinomonas fungiae TaxID=1137284 RepID=A0A0K6IP17_9GAMM|nr:prepilin-type N-terminal cleavage/methylation domain [Marinomonas fungiae]
MVEKGEKETLRIFLVMPYNTAPRNADGFTLLELLVVLSILAVMVSLVAPNLTGLVAQDKARLEANTLRQALQTVIDQSWLEGRSSVIELRQNELLVWRRQGEQWLSEGAVYRLQSGLEYQLSTQNKYLSNARQSLNFPGNMSWVTLANAEYLPFRWRIQSHSHSYILVGDGINGLQLEE